MRDHDALLPRGCPAGVVDTQQVTLADVRAQVVGPGVRQQRFVVQPAGPVASSLERHEVHDRGNLLAYLVNRVEIVRVRADDPRAGVRDEIREITGRESIVDGHYNRTDLWNGVIALQMRVCVRRDICDAVALLHA